MDSDNQNGWVKRTGYIGETKIKKEIINYLEGGADSFLHKMNLYREALKWDSCKYASLVLYFWYKVDSLCFWATPFIKNKANQNKKTDLEEEIPWGLFLCEKPCKQAVLWVNKISILFATQNTKRCVSVPLKWYLGLPRNTSLFLGTASHQT